MKIIYSLRTAIFYDVVKRNDVGVYGEQEMHRSTLIKKKKRSRKIDTSQTRGWDCRHSGNYEDGGFIDSNICQY